MTTNTFMLSSANRSMDDNLNDNSVSRISVSMEDCQNKETIEQLNRCLREFECENLELKRALPRLRKANGDDCTEWAIKIIAELEQEQKEHNETQKSLALLTRRFREFKDTAEENGQRDAKAIAELRQQTEEYEEENRKLRDRLRDDQSEIFNLRRRLVEVLEDEEDGGQHSPEENSEQNHLRVCLEHLDRRSDTEEQESGHSTQRRLKHQLHKSFSIIAFLFEKYRSFGSFANSIVCLLTDHGDTQNASLLRKINDMKLDLNQSMEKCKRSLSLKDYFEQTICTKCKLLENERDALKVQLNNEIISKQRFLDKSEISERNLREARRHIEELGGELRASLAKAEQIEETERKIKEFQEDARSKDEHFRTKSKELEKMAEQILILRQQNLELDAKNEKILKAVQRLKEIHADEMNGKDIEMQRQGESVEYLDQRCRTLEEQFMNEKEKCNSLEKEDKKKDELVKKFSNKTRAFRRLLMQYGHYLDSSKEYETLVERSSRILQDKMTDGQRCCSSSSNQPTTHQQHQSDRE